MKKIIRSVTALALLVFFIVPHTSSAAFISGLNESQVQSIISLLQSFGATQSSIDAVDYALRGDYVDLIATAPQLSIDSPEAVEGSFLKVAATVQNVGNVATVGGFTAVFEIDTNNDGVVDLTRVREITAPLQEGGFVEKTANWTAVAGTNRIRFCVDTTSGIGEPNEDNNCAETLITVVAVEPESVTLTELGAIGDGSAAHKTINRTALINALNSGSPSVVIPSGTYVIEVLGTNFAPLASTTISGATDGSTTLIFESQTTTYKELFRIVNDAVTIDHVNIVYRGLTNESVQLFMMRANNFTLSNSSIDGGNTPTNANLTNAFMFTSDNVDNLRLINNDIHNLQRVFLRTNLQTGLISNVEIRGNAVHDLGQGGIQFNTPTQPAHNIQVIDNVFSTFHAGTEQIFLGFAGARNVTISNNQFSGQAKNCIHLEEDVSDVLIENNTCRTTFHGVFLNDNNAAGVPSHPRNVTIRGNTFENILTTRTGDGINATVNPTAMTAFSNLTLTNNSFKGYDNAINLDKDTYSIQGNAMQDCNIGIKLWGSISSSIQNNTFSNCTTTIFPRNR